jgi:hypothetical protein
MIINKSKAGSERCALGYNERPVFGRAESGIAEVLGESAVAEPIRELAIMSASGLLIS